MLIDVIFVLDGLLKKLLQKVIKSQFQKEIRDTTEMFLKITPRMLKSGIIHKYFSQRNITAILVC